MSKQQPCSHGDVKIDINEKGRPRHPLDYRNTNFLKRGLYRMLICFWNFSPSFLTWYSIISITGVDPRNLITDGASKKVILPILIVQACWLLIYFIGILVMTFQNLNWWKICYQIEAVKEDRVCRLFIFLIGCATLIVQILIWKHFHEECANATDQSSICEQLSSPMTFTYTCVLAAFGLYSISTYNGGFYAQLPYDSDTFNLLQLPYQKILCFNVPQVWLDTSEILSTLETMLALNSSAFNDCAHRESDFKEALKAMQKSYQHDFVSDTSPERQEKNQDYVNNLKRVYEDLIKHTKKESQFGPAVSKLQYYWSLSESDFEEAIKTLEGACSSDLRKLNFEKTLQTVQGAYDHLPWNWLEGVQGEHEALATMKKSFTLTSKTLTVKEEDVTGNRLFDQEYRTEIALRFVYIAMFTLMLLPLLVPVLVLAYLWVSSCVKAVLEALCKTKKEDSGKNKSSGKSSLVCLAVILFSPIILLSLLFFIFDGQFIGITDKILRYKKSK